jgi:hypothetical protein
LIRERAVALRRHAPLAAVLLSGLAAHVALAPHLALRGAAPDVVLVPVVVVAATRGARAGAACGFAAGLGADLFLSTPLGTSALAYTVVGHVLGRASRTGPSGTAAALCNPASTCFACRTGRSHAAGPTGETLRPRRARRRVAERRAALRRSFVLTAVGVAGGRFAAAGVAAALAGVPFAGVAGLVHVAAVGVISAPLGPPVFIAVRRLTAEGPGRRR